MYSLFFIAKNNIKKHKGEVAILFILIFLAAFLLFTSLSLMLSGQGTIDACEKTYHTSDLLVFQPTGLTAEETYDIVASVPGSDLIESAPVINWNANYYYGNKTADDATAYMLFLTDASKPTYLNALPDICNDLKDDEIVLPYSQKSIMKVGEPFHIVGNGMDLEFKVKGYLENLYFATSMDISGFFCAVSHNTYEKISNALHPSYTGSFVYCRLQDGVDGNEYDKAVTSAFDVAHKPNTVVKSVIIAGTKMLSDLASSIVLIFTVILVGLALIIMHFSIKNFIEMNIQNIGLLQASGYCSTALRFACVIEEMLICVLATVAAVGIGLLITAPLNSLQGILMGLSGFKGICVPALLVTLIGIPVAVFLGTLLASRSYKKLTVLESLRSGLSSHNFKKNYCPLEKSKLPLNLALSLKQILGRKKKNLFIALIIACLTISTCLGFSLYENLGLDQKPLLQLIGFETGDLQATITDDPTIMDTLTADDRVDHLLKNGSLASIDVMLMDHYTTLTVDTYDDLSKLEYESILEGHAPEKETEIILTCVEADKLHAKVGDVVNVKGQSGESIPFTVSGIDQKINNLGNKAMVTEEGAKRINPEFEMSSVIIYLKNGISPKEYSKELSAKHTKSTVLLVQDLIGNTIDSLCGAMNAICVIFVAMTCFVVILTEILLTRSQIIRERSELGVSKAIGYTSGELVRRMILSNLPTVILGVCLGYIMYVFLENKVMYLSLANFGIKQSDLTSSPIWFPITMVIIVFCAVITSYLNSRSISKLEPVRILKED
ncbi:MAG: FtsX-like permease family protein [Clostridiales bacterium]|nr:FtsX-like permease family protein [Clostridiales bacterium]